MPRSQAPLTPEEALGLLCRHLASSKRSESDQEFTRYHNRLQPELIRYLASRLRFDKQRAEELFTDLMSQHAIQLVQRGILAEAIQSRLDLVDPPRADPFLANRFQTWRIELRCAVDESMRLPFRQASLSPIELLTTVRQSNARLSAARAEGVQCLDRALAGAGLTLGNPAAVAEAGKAGAGIGEEDDAPTARRARQLDRLLRPVMAVTPAERRRRFLEAAPELAEADPALIDLAADVSELLYMTARVRLPLLGLLYRMAQNLATDLMRADARIVSLDELIDAEAADDEGRRTDLSVQKVLDDDASKYFAGMEVVELLQSVVSALEAPLRETKAKLQATTTDSERRKATLRLERAQRNCGLAKQVLFLRIQGYTQQEIADQLDLTRDQIRTNLDHIEKALTDLRASGADEESTS